MLTDHANHLSIWRPSENIAYELGESGYLCGSRIVISQQMGCFLILADSPSHSSNKPFITSFKTHPSPNLVQASHYRQPTPQYPYKSPVNISVA